MKKSAITTFLIVTCFLAVPLVAAETKSDAKASGSAKSPAETAAKSEVAAELGRLVSAINTKIKEGKRAETDFEVELKQFDALLAAHKGEKTDDLSRVAYMKATLYLQIFNDEAKGAGLLEQLVKDFPDTRYGKSAESRLKSMAAQAHLAVGKQFPEFSETDLDGKPLSVAGFKGKVLLVDFWATWCGPCIGELPNVKQTYEKHHQNGFEIVGISLDDDKSKLTAFLSKNQMPWRQFFDGQGWKNKLAQQYGVNSIPATYLLDGEGRIIAKNLRGEALEAAVAKALAQGK